MSSFWFPSSPCMRERNTSLRLVGKPVLPLENTIQLSESEKMVWSNLTRCLQGIDQARSHHVLDITIPQNPWRRLLDLVTPTYEPIWPHFHRPFRVLIFPAVAPAAFPYVAGVGWLTATSCRLSRVLPEPPYLFSPEKMGYTNAGPLIGNICVVYGGFFSNGSILYYTKRNKDYHEPEMRLYILRLPAFFMVGGLIMLDATSSRAREQHSQSKFSLRLRLC